MKIFPILYCLSLYWSSMYRYVCMYLLTHALVLMYVYVPTTMLECLKSNWSFDLSYQCVKDNFFSCVCKMLFFFQTMRTRTSTPRMVELLLIVILWPGAVQRKTGTRLVNLIWLQILELIVLNNRLLGLTMECPAFCWSWTRYITLKKYCFHASNRCMKTTVRGIRGKAFAICRLYKHFDGNILVFMQIMLIKFFYELLIFRLL